MKTVCFIETDSDGNVEWSEGCVCEDNVYEHSKELVDKAEVEAAIAKLQERISVLEWGANPERMGA